MQTFYLCMHYITGQASMGAGKEKKRPEPSHDGKLQEAIMRTEPPRSVHLGVTKLCNFDHPAIRDRAETLVQGTDTPKILCKLLDPIPVFLSRRRTDSIRGR